jgi:NAD(P)-dependent dehydrogenase (short-subunit alcohol dehydrogenase family)
MTNNNTPVVLVTGANRGIGLALCKQYKDMGYQVIATCRSRSEALEALENDGSGIELIEGVDVSKVTGIQALQEQLNERHIDILINNAGILRSQTLNRLDFEEIIEQFQVNTLGPLRIVDALRNNLCSGGKIAMITSRMGSIEDNTSGGQYGYRMSKSALNAASKSLALDLQPRGIALAILHPGYVQTEMVNFGGEIAADVAAERLVQRIAELNLENSGTFWHSNGDVLPW